MHLLTPIKRHMMTQVARLNGQITPQELTEPRGSSEARLQDLLDAGYIEIVPHKTKIDPVTGLAPDALAITPLGRDILELDGRE
ncbi:MAG TPA: hypothetical protein VFY83_00640 [Anaerolineales bacterium]|nr:hypothetical protein [Anaerolineales bacterium]